MTRMWSSSRSGGLAAVVVGAVLVTACGGGRGGSVPYVETAMPAPDQQAQPVALANVPIGALDKLRILVFEEEALSGEFVVDDSGKVDYPLIGVVQAQGKTTQELGSHLAALLGTKYLQSPRVSVSIEERAEQTVTVDGSVNRPGVFAVKGPTTLMQAVAMARGTTEDANMNRVYLFRTINGERVAGAFDLQSIRRGKADDPVVYGNDMIIVDGSRARRMFQDILMAVPTLRVLRPF